MPELEPDVALPPMLPGEQVIEDYRHLHLSLKAHPVSFLRADLDARGIVRHELSARHAPRPDRHGRRARAGAPASRHRQRHLHDAGGRDRASPTPSCGRACSSAGARSCMGARLISVTGELQNEKGVIHIVARSVRGSDAAAAPPVGGRLPHRSVRTDRRNQAAGAGLMAPSAQDPDADRRGARRNPQPLPPSPLRRFIRAAGEGKARRRCSRPRSSRSPRCCRRAGIFTESRASPPAVPAKAGTTVED